jgi:dihydrofolate reductase
MGAVVGEAIAASDAFLLGRRTYEEWAALWPTEAAAENPMAAR